MDWIQLTGVNATGYHGVFEHERRNGQVFHVDVAMGCNFGPAAASDDVVDTIHYGEVANLVHAHITGEPVNLIEKLAARIAADILENFPAVEEIEVTVHKPQAPIEVPFGSVAVKHRRARTHTQQTEAVLALGANLDSAAGDKTATLNAAVAALAAHEQIDVVGRSTQIITEPVGGPEGQPEYANMVIKVATSLKPFELLGVCQQIEADHGRVREVHWGPRTLDIDVITYGELEQDSPVLTLPHPRAHERGFVLEPWAQIDPEAKLNGRAVSTWLEGLHD